MSFTLDGLTCTEDDDDTCLDLVPLESCGDESLNVVVQGGLNPTCTHYADLVCKVNELITAHNRLAVLSCFIANKNILTVMSQNIQALQLSVVALEKKYLTL